MQAQELKSLVEAGSYKPDPSRVAMAMLERRSVRELLTGGLALSAAGQSPSAPESPRQAA
jgi:ribosomal protein L12E/L44/L45/RPP1/RPP2